MLVEDWTAAADDEEARADLVVAALDGLCFPRVLRQPHPNIDGFRAVLLDQLAFTLGVKT